MLQEELEVAAEVTEENSEEEVRWPVGAQVRPVVVHPEVLEMTIHQFARVYYQPTIHQSFVVWCWYVATIHWSLVEVCQWVPTIHWLSTPCRCLMMVEVVHHPQDHP